MTTSTHNILAGKWHELKGKVKAQWGKLTDDDITQMSGRGEELAGLLQQRYGYDKAKAQEEIAKWMEDHDKSCRS